MKVLHILPIGELDPRVLEWLRRELVEEFRIPCEVLDTNLDPRFAYHPERQQYHSSEIIAKMQEFVRRDTWRLLGLTASDLYIPILTFVFGEAQMGGPASVVSLHRLRQEFYGLPADVNLLARRLLTECVHELGHTLDLTHCHDYTCVMAASHAVEWIDLKNNGFCDDCGEKVRVVAQW
jgi:archaemetzincin